ncbi:MAG: CoA ester lyase [Sphingomonadales bacterium]|nr:CoA ester lyase [Sphingomonadales bacterium]
MSEPRSWLFVPGDSEKKIAKALASEADAVIIDLEDSVADANKDAARALAAETLADAGETGPRIWVRINPLDSGRAEPDIAAIAAAAPHGVMLPKAESGADIALTARYIDEAGGAEAIRICAVATETARSLFGLDSYADASDRLAMLTWGAEDLSAALGATSKYDISGELSFTYRLARSLCLAGAVAAGVQPVDTLYADFGDEEGLMRDCEAGRREGFTGKLAIHPAQLPVINAAFTPSEEELAEARRIIAAFADHPEAGTIGLDGRMIDRPHLVQAQRTVARAKRG